MTPIDLLRGKRTSLYVRLSRASDDRNLSRQGMVDDLRALCAARGFVEVALHVDDGRSGAVRDRPEFRAWLADAIEGRADVLVAWHVDRLSREGLNVAAIILDVIEGKDPTTGREVRPPVRLIGYDDRLDSADAEGFRLNFVIKAEQARAELARMKSRSRARVQRMRKDKRSTGGLTPYGYQRAPRGPMELEHDPVSAPIIQDVVRRVIGGESIASVARDLNARGVLSPRDHAALRDTGEPRKNKETREPLPPQRWTDETLRRMLTNPVLLGWLTDDRKVVRDNDGAPVLRGEALISKEDWGALQGVITGAKRPKHRSAPDAMLSGEVFCPECGEVLHFHWSVKPTQEYRYYRCSGRTRRENGCKAGAPRAERVERLTEDALLGVVGDLDVMRKVYVPGDDIAAQLADVAERMRELREDRQAGLYRGEQGTAEFREMYSNLERLRDELTAKPSRSEGWEYVSTGQTYRDVWESSDTAGRRTLIRDSGIRLEAIKATGDVSPGLFERPGEYAVCCTLAGDGVRLWMYLPPNLSERVTGKDTAAIRFVQRPLPPLQGQPAFPDKAVAI
ncbi:recombinase family protein [Plantactinospora sp. KLBMP9567]|uniref:recombinase family protein n=1 Tax=Plantactinospora sp. KLBMP9567 TaxID=3085900 RepID=UPI0029815030|nr:recombinase family protein [Plantactinospora sp. KLBMP9567]MDW5326040.1 recombinase family protein [Plantactinospora sp. KLBMP9567]